MQSGNRTAPDVFILSERKTMPFADKVEATCFFLSYLAKCVNTKKDSPVAQTFSLRLQRVILHRLMRVQLPLDASPTKIQTILSLYSY